MKTDRPQQFVAVDTRTGATTYWRTDQTRPDEIYRVVVPWRGGQEDLGSLSAADRDFVERNVTPAELAEMGGQG